MVIFWKFNSLLARPIQMPLNQTLSMYQQVQRHNRGWSTKLLFINHSQVARLIQSWQVGFFNEWTRTEWKLNSPQDEDESKLAPVDHYAHSRCITCQRCRNAWVNSFLNDAVIVSWMANLTNSLKFHVCMLIAPEGELHLSCPPVAYTLLILPTWITKQKVSSYYSHWTKLRWSWASH